MLLVVGEPGSEHDPIYNLNLLAPKETVLAEMKASKQGGSDPSSGPFQTTRRAGIPGTSQNGFRSDKKYAFIFFARLRITSQTAS